MAATLLTRKPLLVSNAFGGTGRCSSPADRRDLLRPAVRGRTKFQHSLFVCRVAIELVIKPAVRSFCPNRLLHHHNCRRRYGVSIASAHGVALHQDLPRQAGHQSPPEGGGRKMASNEGSEEKEWISPLDAGIRQKQAEKAAALGPDVEIRLVGFQLPVWPNLPSRLLPRSCCRHSPSPHPYCTVSWNGLQR